MINGQVHELQVEKKGNGEIQLHFPPEVELVKLSKEEVIPYEGPMQLICSLRRREVVFIL